MSYTFTSGQILTAADLNAVIAQTASTGTNASSLSTGTVAESVLPYRMNQNVTTTSNVTFANVVITGNLTVQGVTTSINTSNLDITDLNITVGKNAANSLQANGGGLTIAGANAQFYYNDTSNNMILNLPISIGNATGNATISSINLNVNGAFIANTTGAYHTGIVNAASHTVGSSFIANATGAYHTGTVNAASHTVGATFTANATLVNAAAINITGQVNTATLYATTSANVGANLQVNTTALFIGNSTVNSTISAGNLNVNGVFIANNSGAYHTGTVNAASHTTTNSVVNTSQISIGTVNSTANGVVANTTAILIGNSTVNATINSTAFTGTVLSANNAAYLGGTIASSYALSSALGSYQTTAGLSANVATLTANNATYLGGLPAASFVSSVANINFTGANIYFGNSTTISNVYFQNNSVLYANNRFGTVNQVLSSNGSAMHWADVSAVAVNTFTQYSWSNTQTFTNTISFSGNLNITGANSYFGSKATFAANVVLSAGIDVIDSTGARGTAGQVLTSNGTGNVYWSTVSGSAGATYVQNTDSRTLSGNLYFTGANSYFGGKTTHAANLVLSSGIDVIDSTGARGTVGQVLTSNGAGNVYWSTVSASVGATYVQNTDSRTLSGNLNFTGVNNYFTNIYVGANVGANATALYVGNSTVFANVTASQIILSSNSTNTATINSTSFTGTANNATYLGNVAAASYQTTAGLSANVATISANNASYLGGTLAANYVQNTDSRTLSGNLYFTGANSYFSGKATHAANLVLSAGIDVIDSTGARGTAGQVLTSNGTGNVYWSTVSASPGATYVQNTDSRTLSGNLYFTGSNSYFAGKATFAANVVLAAGIDFIDSTGSRGTAGQVLTSNGTSNVYWSTVSASPGATYVQNTDSRTLSGNLNFTGVNNYFSTALYVGANVGANATALYVGNSTVFANVTAGQLIFSSNSTNTATINSTAFTGTANNASYLANVAAANYVQNTDSRTLSGNLNFTGANQYFGTALYVGANAGINTSAHFVGNSTVFANVTAGQLIFSSNSTNTATINSTAFTGTANNASYLSNVAASAYVQNTDSRTLSGTIVFSANLFAPTMANGTSNTTVATTNYVQNSLMRVYYANGTQAFP
jgi:ribosomal protein S28E/S33